MDSSQCAQGIYRVFGTAPVCSLAHGQQQLRSGAVTPSALRVASFRPCRYAQTLDFEPPTTAFCGILGIVSTILRHGRQVGILVLDNNASGGSAVKQILDSRAGGFASVSDAHMLLSELKTGEWSW